MSCDPSAPPPSYDDLPETRDCATENLKCQEIPIDVIECKSTNSVVDVALELQTNPYAYSQMCLTSPCVVAQPTDIQAQTIVVQPQVIQGTGLIANADGTYDFGPYPCRVLCPECHKTTQTKIKYKNSGFTHILAGLLCLLGCCCLAPVPYCINNCKNSVHHCGECGKYLGTYVNGYSVSRYQKHNKHRQCHLNDKSSGAQCCHYNPRC